MITVLSGNMGRQCQAAKCDSTSSAQAVWRWLPAGRKLREPPSLADEAVLLKYYKGRVQTLCRAFGYPAKVQAAAITFLSRFYLRNSPLEHDIKDIMLACL